MLFEFFTMYMYYLIPKKKKKITVAIKKKIKLKNIKGTYSRIKEKKQTLFLVLCLPAYCPAVKAPKPSTARQSSRAVQLLLPPQNTAPEQLPVSCGGTRTAALGQTGETP